MAKSTAEHRALLDQIQQIAEGIGATFAPFCEVVVHDLLDPEHAIVSIHNNLSGREVGAPATELGLARISDPEYPQLIANYANHFADGRQTKSTSIGIKDAHGKYIAALCMNVDLTLFRGLQNVLGQFSRVEGAPLQESLDPTGANEIRERIDQFAARLATTPHALKSEDRRALIRELKESGCMEIRHAMAIVARHLGVSRATAYNDAK
ncbi:helix-turn-helix transcriptional regulator [Verminephrobacter aporrectodeae]|uniref:helix-turn-helix transcriptional regulator n=1 Tax=Verminephrobacter aporrectodeae TaxID=1110389 RepID=UPI002238111D|nr:helix-turn-helix transcriptional regulator [Verminephrobacter aporrectodeae]MCW5221232.1 transcriptional regulator [Verminephrobacter aporrectodeae subsp. tuberculatae]MCW5254991.1 transcriptional regulator [Verminephrobacter aporrectodeae subsp. tuberculatae]MCW5290523.1 transcriptional regulator [Verminephrobacter aporrectodeae subsp. tuberculatae]MCW8176560.1 transcriptional regulator [Verminephrobacter aporrectodeae subsp. tuberculatae]MCW8199323.1 transcriptional regulator [Verminephro